MATEIIIAGLTSFLNPRDSNPEMGEPAFILVRADGSVPHGQHHHHGPAAVHIPFIAFDSAKFDLSGGKWKVNQVLGKADVATFKFIKLDGVELAITGDAYVRPDEQAGTKGSLDVHPSYDDLVVKKDDYWPAAKDKFNRDFVPLRGGRPKKNAVAAFVRFGSGTIEAGRQLQEEWEFPIDGDAAKNGTHKRRFARDVVYSGFLQPDGVVAFTVVTLDEPAKPLGEIRLTPKAGAAAPLQIFIGNNVKTDIKNVVKREQPKTVNVDHGGEHFFFLNRVAESELGDGPTPQVIPNDDTGGGGEDGFCGPGSGNH